MSRGCQKHSGNLFCTSCRIRLCTVLAWQFPHLKGRLELYTNWTTALSAEQPHLLKVCWLVRGSANSLYPYLPTNGCLTPAFNHCESSNTSVYPRCLHFRDIFSGWEMTSLFYFYANVCCEYSPCWSHSHNLSLFFVRTHGCQLHRLYAHHAESCQNTPPMFAAWFGDLLVPRPEMRTCGGRYGTPISSEKRSNQ